MKKKWRVVGINFAHMHMGDNLRMVFNHPDAEIVGVADEDRAAMESAVQNFSLTEEQVFTDYRECLEKTRPDIAILCPPTAEHAEWVEKVAEYPVHIILEKPFADSTEHVERILKAMERHGKQILVNWPLAWYPPHVKSKRVIEAGTIGEVLEVHYYDGNRGPLWHLADKVETTEEDVMRDKPESWFYKRSEGGGSLLDYLGYGVTLGTWYHDGKKPLEILSMVDQPEGLEVDEHSITIIRYKQGLSKFETRWGTFTDPWTHQPQPKCGFVIVGTKGTVSSYDFEDHIRVQTKQRPEGEDLPVDALVAPNRNPVEYLIDCLEHDRPVEGPVSAAVSRIGQVLVDAAFKSSVTKRPVDLRDYPW